MRTWTLFDSEQGVPPADQKIIVEEVGRPDQGCSVALATLRGGSSEGVVTARIDNGELECLVVPSRGMGLWKLWRGGHEFGWKSPVAGPVHPSFVPLMEPSGLGWLSGFDELMVRCGLESNGAPEFDPEGRLRYPLHGRIANQPARSLALAIDDDSGELTLTGVVEESRFLFQRLRLVSTLRTVVGAGWVEWTDEIENVGGSASAMQLLYHVNFGPPLLGSGSEVRLPLKTLVPRDPRAAEGIARWNSFLGPTAGYAEQVYFAELFGDADRKTQVLLQNASATLGASLSYSLDELPCFTLWKNTAAEADGYVTGLEPGTNFPNPRAVEERLGRVVPLAPGQKRSYTVRLEALVGSGEVSAAAAVVEALQGNARPTIHATPQPDWRFAP